MLDVTYPTRGRRNPRRAHWRSYISTSITFQLTRHSPIIITRPSHPTNGIIYPGSRLRRPNFLYEDTRFNAPRSRLPHRPGNVLTGGNSHGDTGRCVPGRAREVVTVAARCRLSIPGRGGWRGDWDSQAPTSTVNRWRNLEPGPRLDTTAWAYRPGGDRVKLPRGSYDVTNVVYESLR